MLSYHIYSQDKENHLWMLGYDNIWHNDSSYLSVGNTSFDFNYNPMQAKWESICKIDFHETCATICDKNGNLLFYTNGVVVANMEHDTMENGAGLNPGYYTEIYSGGGGNRIMQSALILPYPNHENLYYILHNAPELDENGNGLWYPTSLLFSLVDMSANGGLGKVVEKNQVLIQDTLCYAGITACRHANGRDWWLMIPEYGNNYFYRILLSPEGFSLEGKQCLGYRDRYDGWQAYFSPDGKKYARHGITNIQLFDFDRCTGMFSNPDTIGIPHNSPWWWLGGLAFAPNSKYLYFSSELFVYQLDTDAPDVAASMQLVAEYDTIKVEVPPGSGVWLPVPFWFMGLAPNGKIYIVPPNAAQVMHVIEEPDLPGLACNLVQRGQPLPTINAYTIPNFPHFRLGAEVGSGCDTLGTVSIAQPQASNIKVYPNPAQDKLTIESSATLQAATFLLYDISGKVVARQEMIGNKHSLLVGKLAKGAYFYEVILKDKKEYGKLFIE